MGRRERHGKGVRSVTDAPCLLTAFVFFPPWTRWKIKAVRGQRIRTPAARSYTRQSSAARRPGQLQKRQQPPRDYVVVARIFVPNLSRFCISLLTQRRFTTLVPATRSIRIFFTDVAFCKHVLNGISMIQWQF